MQGAKSGACVSVGAWVYKKGVRACGGVDP